MNQIKRTRRRENNLSIRKSEILNAAIEVAKKIGYQSITRETVALAADTSCALVTRYFTTMAQLKGAVMMTAIDREILPIIAQGLSLGDARALKIQEELKQKVITFLSN